MAVTFSGELATRSTTPCLKSQGACIPSPKSVQCLADVKPLCRTKGPVYSLAYTLEHPLGETTLGSRGHSLAWLSPFLFCFPPSFTGFPHRPSLNNPCGSNSSDAVSKESDPGQTLYCVQFLKMSLNLGYHSGTIAWDPFELCSQTIPHLCSLVV